MTPTDEFSLHNLMRYFLLRTDALPFRCETSSKEIAVCWLPCQYDNEKT